jgi:hypothetical protein
MPTEAQMNANRQNAKKNVRPKNRRRQGRIQPQRHPPPTRYRPAPVGGARFSVLRRASARRFGSPLAAYPDFASHKPHFPCKSLIPKRNVRPTARPAGDSRVQ